MKQVLAGVALSVSMVCMASASTVAYASTVQSATTHVSPGAEGVYTATKAAQVHSTKDGLAKTVNGTYIVRSGDSLWAIASRFHTSVSVLTKLNNLSTRSVLHVGQKLSVPGAPVKKLSGRSDSDVAGLASAAKGEVLAQFAERFQGTPYRWGGTTPSGFDCSGFVYYVFRQYGVYLPRTSYDMYGVGTSVSRSDLMPGMLVFFDSYGPGASHVGIYIGGGQFISAQGNGVRIASLSEGYWASHYMGARSVLH